jgi:hypothetical protein
MDGGTQPETWHCYWAHPLIAICRCYVASQLGDEVEVPDEIFKG